MSRLDRGPGKLLQVRFEECLHLFVELHSIFRILEPMSFIHFDKVFYRASFGLEGLDNLLCLGVVYAGIIVALCDKKRRFDLVSCEKRRTGEEEFAISFGIADPFVHEVPECFPIGWNRSS